MSESTLNLELQSFHKSQLLLLLDLIEGCTQVEHQEDINRILDRLDDLIPFDEAIICSFANEESGIALKEIINHSYSSEWVSTYLENGFTAVDPVFATALSAPQVFTWTDAFQSQFQIASTEEKMFADASMDFGYINGYTSSVYNSENKSAMLFSIKSNQTLLPSQLHALRLITPHLERASDSILTKRKQTSRDALLYELTRRELEVLQWAVAGKTALEIGLILSITERTVKYHLGNIYQKLDVMNRAHAIAKAVNFGLVSISN